MPSKINIDNSDGSNSPGSIGMIRSKDRHPVKYAAREEPSFAVTNTAEAAQTKTDARRTSVF